MEGRLRVLKALANYPCPVGVGCFAGFAKHAWPDEAQGSADTSGRFSWTKTGWVITDAGLAELARLEDVLRSAELGGSQETSDAQR